MLASLYTNSHRQSESALKNFKVHPFWKMLIKLQINIKRDLKQVIEIQAQQAEDWRKDSPEAWNLYLTNNSDRKTVRIKTYLRIMN